MKTWIARCFVVAAIVSVIYTYFAMVDQFHAAAAVRVIVA